MESILKKLDLETGEEVEETNTDMVKTAFMRFTDFEATDWELAGMIKQLYDTDVDERNFVSPRRSELEVEGLVIATEKRRAGNFGKLCTVWRFVPDGIKPEKDCLSSNEMNRAIKKVQDYCQKANDYQIKELKGIIERFER